MRDGDVGGFATRGVMDGWWRRVLVFGLVAGATWASCGCVGPGGGARDRASRASAAEADVLADQASASAASGDVTRALEEFAQAIEVNPSLTRAHVGMAEIYRAQGDYGNAQVGYERAAELEPQVAQHHYFNGLMLHLLERVTEAIQAYLRALAIEPEDFESNLNLATAYYQLKEIRQAVEYAERAVRINPDSGPARLNLGVVYASLGRHREAVREYQQAAELMELTPNLLMNMAESLGRSGEYALMRNTLEQLLRKEETAAGYERLGYAEFKMRRYDEALTAFRSALRLEGAYYPALNGVGVCLLNRWVWSGKTDESARRGAVDALRGSLRINGNQPRIKELLGRYGR